MILQGEVHQMLPIADSARLSIKLVRHGTLKTYPGFPHGMATTHADVINADLLAFFKAACTTSRSATRLHGCPAPEGHAGLAAARSPPRLPRVAAFFPGNCHGTGRIVDRKRVGEGRR